MPGPNQEDGDVSKRPKTATGVMSRLRRPADRLRDLPIWSKLGLIMLVPTLATIIVGVSGLVDHINTASNAERARAATRGGPSITTKSACRAICGASWCSRSKRTPSGGW